MNKKPSRIRLPRISESAFGFATMFVVKLDTKNAPLNPK